MNEELLKEKVIPYLEQGRPKWDVPHTLAVVKWMKILIENEDVDSEILIPAAYLHDVGYYKMFKDVANYKDVIDAKKNHMDKGPEIAKKILEELNFEKIEEIIELVRKHDNYTNIESHYEQLLFEADTLGALDANIKYGTYNKEDRKKYLQSVREKRLRYVKTEIGKKEIIKFLELIESNLE